MFDDFWMSELQNAWTWNFGSFWSFFKRFLGPFGRFRALEKRPKVKKRCKQRYFERFLDARALKTMQKNAKTNVLDRLYGEKHVNYCVFDGKQRKNTVKNNVLEGYLAYMFELASGSGTWKKLRKDCK